MGSPIEINDTLQITRSQGFPGDLLSLEAHRAAPVTLERLAGRTFGFHDKDGARLFHLAPVRVFLVENVGGKWLYWGKVEIVRQTIRQSVHDGETWRPGDWVTEGDFRFIEVYDPAYQEAVTRRESPAGKSLFG